MITSVVAIIVVFFYVRCQYSYSSIVLISFIGLLFACTWNVKLTYIHGPQQLMSIFTDLLFACYGMLSQLTSTRIG